MTMTTKTTKSTVKTTAEDFFCGVSGEAGIKYLRENCMGKTVAETIKNLRLEAEMSNDVKLHNHVTHFRLTAFRELARKLHGKE